MDSFVCGLLLALCMLLSSEMLENAKAMCSLMPFGKFKFDSQPYFIGTAQFDPVLAGPGSTESKNEVGHFGRARERPIYGQVVRAQKWGGNPPALQKASATTAIVVPWDYAAD